MVGVGEQAFCPGEARDEVEVVARRAHRDGDRGAAEPDLQGLFGGQRVRAFDRYPVVEVKHPTPLRDPSHARPAYPRRDGRGRRAQTQLDDGFGDAVGDDSAM